MRKNIEEFFNKTAREYSINLNTRLSWGFYFSNNDSKVLRKAKELLDSEGYSTLEICYENKTYYLCVEEINIHTKDTLYNRCKEFENIAQTLHISSFEGFDVEEMGLK
ncbi:ribonuclease E inhibitor RraB [Campylobacterota bacterium DY0563]